MMIALTESEAEGLLEEWGEPVLVNADPTPEPPTRNLRRRWDGGGVEE